MTIVAALGVSAIVVTSLTFIVIYLTRYFAQRRQGEGDVSLTFRQFKTLYDINERQWKFRTVCGTSITLPVYERRYDIFGQRCESNIYVYFLKLRDYMRFCLWYKGISKQQIASKRTQAALALIEQIRKDAKLEAEDEMKFQIGRYNSELILIEKSSLNAAFISLEDLAFYLNKLDSAQKCSLSNYITTHRTRALEVSNLE